MQLSKRNLLLAAAVLFFWLSMLVLGLTRVNSPWEYWKPATCMPNDCFCETIESGLIRQPANTISSLLFVVVGLVIALRPLTSWKPAVPANSEGDREFDAHLSPTTYGGALVVLGFGSAFFHASLTFVGQTADVLGMYLLITFPLIYGLSRLLRIRARLAVTTYWVSNALLLASLIALPAFRRQVFAVLVLLVLALEIFLRWRGYRNNTKFLVGAVALLVGGFTIWLLDISAILCSPSSPLQGHSLWHAAGAGAAALLYAYLEQSRPPQRQSQ